MSWQNFGNLATGNQNLSLFDLLETQVGPCVLIPATAAGGTAITLTGTTNAPALAAYSDLVSFAFIAAATSAGSVTLGYGGLALLPVYYQDGATQVTGAGITIGLPYTATFSQALNAGGGGFYLGQIAKPANSPSTATRQDLISGTALTYTTPALCRQLRIRMVGGGGGGGGAGTTASTNGLGGGTTLFNAIGAAGGGGALSGQSGPGSGGGVGTGGAGAASLRIRGAAGSSGVSTIFSGGGGNSAFGGAGPGSQGSGQQPSPNSGAGGGGSIGASGSAGGGGGAGEYVELIINNPAATYVYTVGAGGVGGIGATSTGAAGAAGRIIVEEFY